MVRAQVQDLVTAQPVMTPLWAAPEVWRAVVHLQCSTVQCLERQCCHLCFLQAGKQGCSAGRQQADLPAGGQA